MNKQILIDAQLKPERDVKNRYDWKKFIKEAKVHIGL